jgi:hypothetical protein
MINVLQIVNILAHIEFKYVLGVGGGDWSKTCNCFTSVMLGREANLCSSAHCYFHISCWKWEIFPSIMFINDYLQGFKTYQLVLANQKIHSTQSLTLLSLTVHHFHFTGQVSGHTFFFAPHNFSFSVSCQLCPLILMSSSKSSRKHDY